MGPRTAAAFVTLLLPLFTRDAVADGPYRAWTLEGLTAIDEKFKRDDGLFAEDTNSRKPSFVWPGGVQLSALNAAGSLDPAWKPRAVAYADALERYRTDKGGVAGYATLPDTPDDERYYDDNAWLVLAFIETHELTGEARFLDRAQVAMGFVMSGEDDALGGGVWWRERRECKNTCSNAPSAAAALRLYQRTRDPKLLEFAKRVRTWTIDHMRDPVDGLFWDHVRTDKSIEKTKWSYNTALMIRTDTLLHAATGERTYLDEAKRMADAAETKWFRPADGALTDEGPFAHLLVEALFELAAIEGDGARVAKLHRALGYLHDSVRSPKTGLYPKRWDRAGEPRRGVWRLIDQASAARAYGVAARTR